MKHTHQDLPGRAGTRKFAGWITMLLAIVLAVRTVYRNEDYRDTVLGGYGIFGGRIAQAEVQRQDRGGEPGSGDNSRLRSQRRQHI